MSQENVEIVRRFNAPHEGENMVLLVQSLLEEVGSDLQPEAILAAWAKDPGLKYVHPEIEWDTSAGGAIGSVARGPMELAQWWVELIDVWESYVYRMLGYDDLGDWVLTPTELRAVGRDGISVEMVSFQVWQVRDAKIAVNRLFLSREAALEAVGLAG
jgi:hypothetical protein